MIRTLLPQLHRDHWARLVGRLIRKTNDWSLAEDCVQEAFERAWKSWESEGIPDLPVAWLTRVATNLAYDQLRRRRVGKEKLERMIAQDRQNASNLGTDDERLQLMFACCHPSLSLESQVALTLRVLVGISVQEIARMLLVSDETISKRLTRAKAKIQDSGIALRLPDDSWFDDRLNGVLSVLYLAFNHGNDAQKDEPYRAALAEEAIRLARVLCELLPRKNEPFGLLALMLFTRSRYPARYDSDGNVVTMEFQDRRLWNLELVGQALTALETAYSNGIAGAYTLQAAIASCHAKAQSAEKTDFAAISSLYAQLEAITDSPIVRLNRSVAVAQDKGPIEALEILQSIEDDPAIRNYPYFYATKAEFLSRLGKTGEARKLWERAIFLSSREEEKEFFRKKIG